MEREDKTNLSVRQEIKTRNILFLVFIFLASTIIAIAFVSYQNFNSQHRLIIAHLRQRVAYTEALPFWYMVILVALTIVSMGMVIWYIYRRKHLIFYREQYNLIELFKESEARYRSLFEAAKDGVLMIDFDTGVILDVNPYLIELLGYSKPDFLKKKFWEVKVFKDATISKDKFLELQKQKFVRHECLPFQTKEGKNIFVECVSNTYSVGDKKIIQCNIRDITERKRLENELAQANEREYRTLIENLPQKVFLKNRNSVYISCNGNYARDLRIKPEEIAGKTDFDFFPKYLAEKYRADDKRVMDSGKTEDIEEEYVVMNGFLGGSQKTIINTVKVPVLDKEGKVVGVFGLFWDITERKQAQDKLYKSQQMFETIVNGITDAVMLITPDYKVVWANDASVKYSGLSGEEIIGKHCYSVTHKQQSHCKSIEHECPIRGILKTGHTKTALHTHIDNDGKQVFVEVTVFPIKDKDGEIVQFIYLQRDITERKKAEDERKYAEEMRAAVEMKSHFTSMVSHELRSPLGAIREGINLVLEGLAGDINNEQKGLLDTAKRNTDRLSRLINNVLDFQKIETGKARFDICKNNIGKLVSEVSESMGILVKEKGLELVIKVDDNIPEIDFDKDRINQVLTNLVNNAILNTEKGQVAIIVKNEANVAHVMVQDTGFGIRDEDMDKLFIAFEQLDSGKGKKKAGSGLGLAISKEIILGHNGKIWAESTIGKGSTFHFILPINERRV